jgi:hypothetical protein
MRITLVYLKFWDMNKRVYHVVELVEILENKVDVLVIHSLAFLSHVA